MNLTRLILFFASATQIAITSAFCQPESNHVHSWAHISNDSLLWKFNKSFYYFFTKSPENIVKGFGKPDTLIKKRGVSKGNGEEYEYITISYPQFTMSFSFFLKGQVPEIDTVELRCDSVLNRFGLGIGMPPDSLLKIFGKPDRRESSGLSNSTMIYILHGEWDDIELVFRLVSNKLAKFVYRFGVEFFSKQKRLRAPQRFRGEQRCTLCL